MAMTKEEIEKRVSDSYEIPNQVLVTADKPMVTIRTSTYNHGPYIRQCIEGVLMQKTDFPYEYIIGEDFSSDETREIVMEYAEKYPDIIRVITADYNVGSKANGTRCIRASRGKYMAICEGDDYWTDPNKLEKQVALLEANPSSYMCVAETRIDDEMKDGEPTYLRGPSKEFLSFDDFNRRCYLHTTTYLIRGFAQIYEEWSNKIRMFDTCLLLICSDKGPVVYLPEVVSVYRKTGQGIHTSLSEGIQIQHSIGIRQDFLKHFKKKYRRRLVRQLAHLYFLRFTEMISSKEWKDWGKVLEQLLVFSLFHPLEMLWAGLIAAKRSTRPIRRMLIPKRS